MAIEFAARPLPMFDIAAMGAAFGFPNAVGAVANMLVTVHGVPCSVGFSSHNARSRHPVQRIMKRQGSIFFRDQNLAVSL
ncbi:hypothetical protein GCM10008941_13460 [Rhizomicrobium palustre]